MACPGMMCVMLRLFELHTLNTPGHAKLVFLRCGRRMYFVTDLIEDVVCPVAASAGPFGQRHGSGTRGGATPPGTDGGSP